MPTTGFISRPVWLVKATCLKACKLCAYTPLSVYSKQSSIYRAAAFEVTGRKISATLSDILRFAHKTARQESISSTVILETRGAWNLRSTTVSTVAVAQLPC